MTASGMFARHREYYGSAGPAVAGMRAVQLITSLVMVAVSAPGVAAESAKGPQQAHYDTLELFGLILGAASMVYSLAGLCPGVPCVTPVRRLFEAGLLLIFFYLAFLLGVALTPGALPRQYVGPGPSVDARRYSGFIAGAISGVLTLIGTAIDFAKRNGPGGGHQGAAVPLNAAGEYEAQA